MLVNRKYLAKTSSTPGKTQTINHFIINDEWFLVDLPGYGYASAAKNLKENWPTMISNYLIHRENLVNTFVLIDTRLDPQAKDKDFIQWMGSKKLPFSIVFTKVDKISKTAAAATVRQWKDELQAHWEETPPMFVTSAEKRIGREDLLEYIEAIVANEKENRVDPT
jgi:GTP-binding protein